MGTKDPTKDQDMELAAMAAVYAALRPLDSEGQSRVLDYVIKRLSLKDQVSLAVDGSRKRAMQNDNISEGVAERPPAESDQGSSHISEEDPDGLEGVSPVAKKWMRRNGFSGSQLSSLFSLGVDEIDLVASSVPGRSVKEKFSNVLLLQGIASYLGSGAPRVDNNKLKQAAGHYGADPGNNQWNYMQALAAEVSGSASSGFTLTARGLNSATGLIKKLVVKT